jgi:hypothetical protein
MLHILDKEPSEMAGKQRSENRLNATTDCVGSEAAANDNRPRLLAPPATPIVCPNDPELAVRAKPSRGEHRQCPHWIRPGSVFQPTLLESEICTQAIKAQNHLVRLSREFEIRGMLVVGSILRTWDVWRIWFLYIGGLVEWPSPVARRKS